MAVVLDAFVGRCLRVLEQLATEEVATILGVKDELRRLREKLEFIKDVLSDAERRRIEDAAVNRWLSKLRDVMYDADDIIDLCRIKGRQLLQAGEGASTVRPRPHRFPLFSSCFTTAASIPFRREIGKEIQKLNQRLKDIHEDRLMSSLQQSASGPNVPVSRVNPNQTSSLPNSDLVGRETKLAADRLADSLVKSESRSLLVFAIVGLGGIGKTTLAQKIYNHQKVQAHFQKTLWVCVSENYSETELLKQMIRGAAGDRVIHAQTKAELQPLLSSALAGNRFLLVLDDVWQADVWEHLLQTPLDHVGPCGGSRVLVTTRNEDVAKSMRAIQTYRVKKLPVNDGWALLCKSVFEDGDDEDMQELREIGMQIVEKCDGLPLAIKAIAGVLRTKDRTKSEWEKVHRSNAWSIRGEIPEAVRGALYLSYEDLPSQLKQCFLYCALFPEDNRFCRRNLTQKWIAEGLVAAQEDSQLEDTAMDCFLNLISRSLLHSNFDTCCNFTMHDLTRSLAVFLTRDEGRFIDTNESTTINPLKLHRLAIRNRKESAVFLRAVENPQCLRSLSITNCLQINIVDIFQRFGHLRVLDLTYSSIKSIPFSIQNLLHLRCLDLSGSTVCELPESLGCLPNLQFLILTSCEFLHTIPKTITQLCNLRFLGLDNTPVNNIPRGIGKLEHLNDLEGFVVGNDDDGCGFDELQSMSQIRHLSIDRLEIVQTEGIQPLKDKAYLKELCLMCTEDADQSLIPERVEEIFEDLFPPPSLEILWFRFFYGLKFPKWLPMLPNLMELYLYCCSSCRQLPPLGKLPKLKELRIEGASAVVSIGSEFLGCDTKKGPTHAGTQTAFPKLEILSIDTMPNWEEWTCGVEGATIKLLPRLRKLQIVDCPMLRSLPEGLQHATSLKDSYIEGCSCLTEINNILSLEELTVINCQCLEKISNLPALREMKVTDSCRMLRFVEKLDTLQSLVLYLEDDWIDSLPEWLLGLIEEARMTGTLHTFSLYCDEALREKCIEGGQYWPLLSHIPDISVSCRFRHY